MSSQAPPQVSRRRSSPPDQTASSPAAEVSMKEQHTNEPQSISLNNPRPAASTISATATPTPASQPTECRTCWICQQDDTDDRPEDSEWRKPCPCSLTAHESCLLEWIADQEAPKRGDLAQNITIACPQCKAEYSIQRPRDPIVSFYASVQHMAKSMIFPTAVSGLVGCLYSGLLVYGLNTTITVFGTEEARSLLGGQIALGRINSCSARGRMAKLLHVLDPFFPTILRVKNYSLFLSMPLIGPSLILLRTSLADQASGILLPIYFLSNQKAQPHFNLTWPPSPGLTFATLPFVKKGYNALYRHTFGDLEKEWDRAVQRQPREGETADQIENQAAEDDGRAIFDVEWVQEEVEVPAQPIAANRVAVAHAVPVAQNQEADGNNQVPVQGVAPRRWALHQDVSAAYIATTVMGALAFPAISSAMGEIINTLPPKWKDRIGAGMLREKWGRTVVGGCLFVVLKDMVTLYCKWRRAKDFGKRKVLDYVGKKGVKK